MALPPIDADLPLAGIRVIDFATTVAGPAASRHLADFGAQVIKVESNIHPDGLRAATPYAANIAGINRSGYFAAYNAGKLSLQLNMQKPRSKEIMRRLVERSDVVVEAFVPGVVARWGLGYEHLSAWNPRIIMASHCLQGQTGPHAKHRGFGQIASAMSGWYDLTGLEGGDPLGPYSAYTDFICWPYLVSAILVALEVRDVTGRGQYIDHAQLETSIHFLAPLLLDLQVNGHLAVRRGNREDYAVPNNVYPCLGGTGGGAPDRRGLGDRTGPPIQDNDRWVAITAADAAAWNALCAVLGHADAADDPRFATFAARKRHEPELDALIGGWTADEEPFALAERLQAAGVPAGVVARAQDLFEDPQLQHRQFFRRLDHAELGNHAVLTQSFRIEGLDPGPWQPAPLFGEHTQDILTDILEMTDDEIADAAAHGCFE